MSPLDKSKFNINKKFNKISGYGILRVSKFESNSE
jgi:hypothetical protein